MPDRQLRPPAFARYQRGVDSEATRPAASMAPAEPAAAGTVEVAAPNRGPEQPVKPLNFFRRGQSVQRPFGQDFEPNLAGGQVDVVPTSRPAGQAELPPERDHAAYRPRLRPTTFHQERQDTGEMRLEAAVPAGRATREPPVSATVLHDPQADPRFIHIVADDPPRRRLTIRSLLFAVAALAIILLFGSIVLMAWRNGVEPRGEPPLIRASDRPIKEPPEAAGGLDVANEDSNVVDALTRGAGGPRVERILPRHDTGPMSIGEAAPELTRTPDTVPGEPPRASEPSVPNIPATDAAPVRPDSSVIAAIPPPADAPSTARLAPTPTVPTPNPASPHPDSRAGTAPPPVSSGRQGAGSSDSVAAADAGAHGDAQRPSSQAVPAQPEATSRPAGRDRVRADATPDATAELAPKPGDQAADRPTVLSPALPGTGQPGTAAETHVAVAAPSARTAPALGMWRIQVAAVGNRLSAESAWRSLRGRHPDLLGSLPVNFEEVKVGAALLVRVQAGSFDERDAAARTCAALRSDGTDCFVVGASR